MFVIRFVGGFTVITDKSFLLEDVSHTRPQVGMRIRTNVLARSACVANNGNEISYGVMYGHLIFFLL